MVKCSFPMCHTNLGNFVFAKENNSFRSSDHPRKTRSFISNSLKLESCLRVANVPLRVLTKWIRSSRGKDACLLFVIDDEYKTLWKKQLRRDKKIDESGCSRKNRSLYLGWSTCPTCAEDVQTGSSSAQPAPTTTTTILLLLLPSTLLFFIDLIFAYLLPFAFFFFFLSQTQTTIIISYTQLIQYNHHHHHLLSPIFTIFTCTLSTRPVPPPSACHFQPSINLSAWPSPMSEWVGEDVPSLLSLCHPSHQLG